MFPLKRREGQAGPAAGDDGGACTVLVPLDGSEVSEEALGAIEALAGVTGLRVLLLRVVPPARPVLADGHVIMAADEVTALHRREATDYLGRLAGGLRGRGRPVDTRVTVGDPAETILATARERGVAAIVMATHGRTGLPRILFGSVTAAVVKQSRIPVLTVHPSARRAPDASPVPRSAGSVHAG